MLRKLLVILLCAFNVQRGDRCRLNTRLHFGEPLPIILKDGKLLEPTDKYGNVYLLFNEKLTISCEGAGSISHPNMIKEVVTETISCGGGDNFKNDDWLRGPAPFSLFRCVTPPNYKSQRTNKTCYEGNPIYEVGYTVQNQFYPVYESCFNEITMNAIYSTYPQKPYSAIYQTKVERPFFIPNDVFGVIPVDTLFSTRGQKTAVAQLVGPMSEHYVSKSEFLSRGHLAAKTDFVFAFAERATFHYVNCAPQWSGFNSGNWNTLEVDLRNYIHNAGLDTIIYTGTYGVTSLADSFGRRVDIHLYTDENNNPVMPVPLYFYKIVYEPKYQRGIVFVGVNNPYYKMSDASSLFFCQDMCRSHDFRWLSWHPDSPSEGLSFCCTIPDFQQVVRHVPKLNVKVLFT